MKRFKKLISVILSLCAITSVMSACSGGRSQNNDVTTITWYLPNTFYGKDKDLVFEKVNDHLEKEYNMKLNIIAIDDGNYNSKMQVINAARENYDLAFTSNWTNDYYTCATNGAFTDITEMLPKYAPALWASMKPELWEAAKVDGKIFAAPNWQIQAKALNLRIPECNIEDVGVDFDAISNLEDIEVYMKKLNEKLPEVDGVGTAYPHILSYYGLVELASEGMPGVIYFEKDGKPTVYNQYELPELRQYFEWKRGMVEKGYLSNVYNPDGKKKKTDRVTTTAYILGGYKPGGATEFELANGYAVRDKVFSKAILSQSSVTATMTGVSATSKHPEKAVQMLEILHTDKYVYNLLAWGIEGTHYTKINDNKIRIVPNSGYDRIANWKLASVKNSYILENQPDDIWEQTEEYNNSAIISPVIGINFKTDEVSVQLANCKTVIAESYAMLELGLVDVDEGLSKLINDLKKAGSDDIINCLQKQIDEWWAANK